MFRKTIKTTYQVMAGLVFAALMLVVLAILIVKGHTYLHILMRQGIW